MSDQAKFLAVFCACLGLNGTCGVGGYYIGATVTQLVDAAYHSSVLTAGGM